MNNRLIIIFSITIFTLLGCNQNNSSMPNEQEEMQNNGIEQTGFKDTQSMNNEQLATHLATVAGDVPDVNNAAAIVAGPYAVVGIDIDHEADRQKAGTIKFTVGEALQHDPYGKTAVVIADADIMERIRQMSDKVKNGHPVQGVVDELAVIVGRYMPTFPVDDNAPDRDNQNNQQINDGDENKLKEIQKEESNQ